MREWNSHVRSSERKKVAAAAAAVVVVVAVEGIEMNRRIRFN